MLVEYKSLPADWYSKQSNKVIEVTCDRKANQEELYNNLILTLVHARNEILSDIQLLSRFDKTRY